MQGARLNFLFSRLGVHRIQTAQEEIPLGLLINFDDAHATSGDRVVSAAGRTLGERRRHEDAFRSDPPGRRRNLLVFQDPVRGGL